MAEPTRRAALATLTAVPAWAAEAGRAAFENPKLWRTEPLDVPGPLPYFIDTAGAIECGDAELAAWALHAWDRASGGAFCFYPATQAIDAHVRIYWGQTGDQLGRMQAIEVDDVRGAEVYVHARPAEFDQTLEWLTADDPLMRDAIVYRTLLHEIGHALGLVHTVGVEDVMYFGGDVVGYYRGYRERVADRAAMRWRPAFSETDLERVRGLYPGAGR